MANTITGTYTTLVTLSAAIDNPTTITASGLLNDSLQVSYTGLALVNAGGIAGGLAGVYFQTGGSVTNQSGGAISGLFAIYGESSGVTVLNAGTITGSLQAVRLQAGGSVTNQSSGTIGGSNGIYGSGSAITVVNAGSIVGTGTGVQLEAGGSVTNQSGGAIYGYDGLYTQNVAVTVVNAGNIGGNTANRGIFLRSSGSVTNQSSGAITGGDGIYGNGGLTVVNAGIIAGNSTNGEGMFLLGGGSVTNQSGGTISGYDGIRGVNPVTVVNAGTISGSRYAVRFAGGYANRLVIDPNAVFSGTVTGGNAIGAAQVSTLELASAGSSGTLSGLGTKYIDFAQVTVDAGAQWSLTGANTLAAGATLTNASTLTDAGTLTNAGTFIGKLTLAPSGVLSNAATGTITASGGAAVYGTTGGAATVVNAGTIAGSTALGGSGIDLTGGGIVTNQSGGSITGRYGLYAQNDAATVVNAGTISGYYGIYGENAVLTVVNAGSIAGSTSGGYGVDLGGGGSVTNQSDGTITGYIGIISVNAALTVVNAGTIIGSRYAVKFAAETASRLIADPGAVFTGNINGGTGVLELASAASAGMLSGLGTSITNFSTLQFDAGAAWTVSGTDSASGLGGIAIAGFANGDTIDLSGFVAVSDTFADNTLVLTDDDGAQDTLGIQGAFTSSSFQLSGDGNGGTDVVVCFCAGTQIGTPAGEVPVEQLRIGDRVLTAHNGPRPVTWIGQGKVLATRGRRSAATPVIVCKGALGDNVPNRDLRVTKAHSLYIDDVLIPVEFLVNHRTILWDDRAQEVAIYHIELDGHDVLLANGAPAESYRDDGNRWLFHNANAGWHLPPQAPYAPVLTGGPMVDAAWRRLLDRAGPRALPPLTGDPDLHLLVDGARVDAEERQGSVYIFRLPPGSKSVVIASREAVPAELGIARDPRSLGVGLRRVAVRQGAKFMLLDADDDRLTVGFHAYEADSHLRWTDGRAVLPAAAFARFDKGAEVMLHLGGVTQYPDERASPARAAA